MRLFVTVFALPVLAAAMVYAVTNQLALPPRIRVPFMVGVIVAALIAAHFAEARYSHDANTASPPRFYLPLSVIISLMALSSLVYMRNPSLGGTSDSPTIGGVQTIGPSTAPAVLSPELIGRPVRTFPKSTKPDGVLDLLAVPRSTRPNSAWPVLMYDESGTAYSILRATAQSALRENGKTTPSIFRSPIPPSSYSDLFNADTSLMSRLRPYCDGLVVGMVTVTTSPSAQFSGMYTTHFRADVKLVSTSDGVRNEFNIEENGAGFSADTSKSNGEERLADKLKAELVKSFSK